MKSVFFLSMLAFSSVTGCSSEAGGGQASDPEESAKIYAKDNGVDLAEDHAYSIREYEDGITSVFDSTRTDPFAVNVVKKLKGKRYWEVCFDNSKGGLGGEACFFIEKGNNQLIYIYRSK